MKTVKQALSQAYPYRIELHAHTSPASPCGDATPEETVRLYLEAGFHGLVITNHFSRAAYGDATRREIARAHLDDYERACNAAEGTGLRVYLGVEVRFDENANDYLLYGVDQDILGKLYDHFATGLAAFRDKVPLPDSVLIQAHPFRNGCEPAEARLLDGIEVFNMHPHHNSRVGLAAKYAADNDLIISGGSDYHDVGWHGLCFLRTKSRMRDSFDVADALRERDVMFEMSGNIVLPYCK